jgi:hypothetical protein
LGFEFPYIKIARIAWPGAKFENEKNFPAQLPTLHEVI